MKIALVYDRVNKIGGAERVLQVLHEIWPQAPLYTSLCDIRNAPWATKFEIKTTFLQWLKILPHEILPNLMPLAFGDFDFGRFDAVISVSSAEAKDIKVKKPTKHICYCLTPTRYLWSGYFDYLKNPGFGRLNFLAHAIFSVFAPLMRMKDFEAAQKVYKFIAISEEVRSRIWKYYRREAKLVYPPVCFPDEGVSREGLEGTEGLEGKGGENYFLIVSRLVPYKQIDLAIRVFNEIVKTLVIVGVGSEEQILKTKARCNIIFKGAVGDNELINLYNNCEALVYPGAEDFGLTSLEAQSYNKPVICNERGGTKETIIIGKTGEIFNNEEELKQIILHFDKNKYQKLDFQKNLLRFSKEKFKEQMNLSINRCHSNER